MSGKARIVFSWCLTVGGLLAAIFGLWAIGAYLWGVIEALDGPDRSWIFWGLAVLVIGILALGVGIVAILGGRRMRQGRQSPDR